MGFSTIKGEPWKLQTLSGLYGTLPDEPSSSGNGQQQKHGKQ